MPCRPHLQIGAGTCPRTRARPRFRHRCKVSTLHQRFTFVRLRGTHLTRSWPRLLTRRSPRRLLIATARADLQPDSASRLRETCSHLRHSFFLHTARLFLFCDGCANQNNRCIDPHLSRHHRSIIQKPMPYGSSDTGIAASFPAGNVNGSSMCKRESSSGFGARPSSSIRVAFQRPVRPFT